MIDLPGVEWSEVNVQLENQVLTIESETRHERGESDKNGGKILRRERHEGHFRRQLILDAPVDRDAMEQKMTRGVLVIRIPKVKTQAWKSLPAYLPAVV